MAASSKKRPASRSPSHSVTARKKERRSTGTSVHSQREFSGSQPSRAKSVFRGHSDPYFPPKNKGTAALPTSDDYIFRVQVVSSTVDVSTDVFKKAVQGLVKICFPQDVLEEIGIEVVTQHMRNEGALEQNIVKMTDIFRSEMIHRVNWMLAEYLDTPEKVEASVKAIIAASASLHGTKIGDDILSHVLAGLQSLRERIPDSSTERLTDGTDIDTMEYNFHEHSSPQSNTDDSGTEHAIRARTEDATQSRPGHRPSHVQPVANTRDKGRVNTVLDMRKTDASSEACRLPRDSLPSKSPDNATMQCKREGKASRISTSWRWDVGEDIAFEDAVLKFDRMSDLFAYHALPIVRQRLGQQTQRKQLRREMERLLVSMPDEQFARWLESFQNLKSGDSTMLERCEPASQSSVDQGVSTTPTPLVARGGIPISTEISKQKTRTNAIGEVAPCSTATKETVKHETRSRPDDADDGLIPKASSPKDQDSKAAGSRHPEIGSDSIGLRYITAQTTGRNISRSSIATELQPRYRTPIIDLLWDPTDFDLKARPSVVQLIMSRLNERIAAQHVGVQRLDGSTKIMTKATLKVRLLARVTPYALQSDPVKVREGMEDKLVPWVVANVSSFPELLSEPLIFLNIIPYFNAVLDLLCDPIMSMAKDNMDAVKSHIFEALSRRGISKSLRSGPKDIVLKTQINGILGESKNSDVMKRGYLERILRYLALDHKENFPELKSTTLVRT